uniref:type II toxin-antitoxin system Phd/YefM family antitoxin n=1 Tax=Cellulomonas hominis TaxID=156981 RepID=UPI003AF3300C
MSLADAASRLPELVQAVEHGDEVTLTRDGRPVARIVAAAGAARRTSGRGAAAGETVAANVSTTAIQLSPPDEAGAAPAPEAQLLPGDGRGAATPESVGAPAGDVPAAPPAPVAAEPEPAAPTRVSTRPAETGATAPVPATTDATIVLDPVPAADPEPDPAAAERPDPPRRRSRRDLAAPTEPLGAVRPETDGD